MVEYKIFKENDLWEVYSGYVSYGDWVKDESVFYSYSLADCYAWIKAKQEGLID